MMMHESYKPGNLVKLTFSNGGTIVLGSVIEDGGKCLSHSFSVKLQDGSFVVFDERKLPVLSDAFDGVSYGAKARLEALARAVPKRFYAPEEFIASLVGVADPMAGRPTTDTPISNELDDAIFRVRHDCDIGNQDVYVVREHGNVDAKRAALYCQFKCEEWLGHQFILSNLAVAAMLVMFYGYRHAAVAREGSYTDIDMYSDRENACEYGLTAELKADTSLHHDGMREAVALLAEPC